MSIVKRQGKRGTSYGVTLWNPSEGRTVWVGSYPSLEVAKRVERDTLAQWAADGGSLREVADEYLRTRHVERNTALVYARALAILCQHFAGRRIESITAREAEGYAAALSDRYAPTTASTYLTVAHQMFIVAQRWGYVAADPFDGWRKPPARVKRPIRPLTAPEHAALVAADAYHAPMFALWPLVGLRRSEMWALRPSDISGGVLHVRQTITRGQTKPYGKSSKAMRSIPLSNEARAILDGFTPTPNAHGLLFVSPQGAQLESSDFEGRVWPKIRTAAGLEWMRLHDLRHTFASWMLAAGVPVNVLCELLGHHSPTVTLTTYAHLMPAATSDAISALDAYRAKE